MRREQERQQSGVVRVPAKRVDDRFACWLHGAPVDGGRCLGCRVAAWWRSMVAGGAP